MSDDTVHSHIGPSSAHRWMNCGASVALITRLKLWGEAAEEAARGTVAHHVSSECLLKNQEAWEYTGQSFTRDGFTFVVDEDMVLACQMYIDLVHATMKKYAHLNPILHIEVRVKSAVDSEAFGTSDVIIEVPGVCIIVIDFKHGHVVVDPSDEQLKLYGIYSYEGRSPAMLDAGEPNRIELVICQPNAFHPKGHIRSFSTTPEELADWLTEEVVPAIANTRDPEANFVVGDWCKYCPALAHCKTYQDSLVKIPVHMLERIAALSNEQITEFRAQRKSMEKFFEAVDKEAFNRIVNLGQKIEGTKPVHKLGTRQWRVNMLMDDPENEGQKVEVNVTTILEQTFKAKAWTEKKLRSPAQIEKLPGGKAVTAQWAYAPSTGLTIADDDDPREPAVGLMDMAAQQAVKETEAANAVPV